MIHLYVFEEFKPSKIWRGSPPERGLGLPRGYALQIAERSSTGRTAQQPGLDAIGR